VVTPLRASSIMWGKLTAAGVQMGYLLLATLPLMAICLWIGGISWDVLAVGSLMCLTTVAVAAAASLCASSLTPTPASGIVVSYAAVLGITYGLPILELVISEVAFHAYSWDPVSMVLIPWSAMVYYIDTDPSSSGVLGFPESAYWVVALVTGLLTTPLLLLIAVLGCRSVAAPLSRLARGR